ncbi:MAG: Asp-tRNA(Asn)/Glu-tRNA(Gln) amidotransferase subunit GatB [Lachnospiraceae bacterium]|nr:Asp-tRNA(Asn)/Glu-tRNA(Gln) amidotransferase subunit GatB [Lachnospiraceae bacterium]
MRAYETVIGLEVHVELSTKTKIFCGCPTRFGAEPNTQICPVCTGMPGALPVLNREVAKDAIAAGLALNCEITRVSRFDRKNYFYPDNPQNYQISQLYAPICRNGYLTVETEAGPKRIGIHEIHMEEDAGKCIHDPSSGCTLVDYNRSGVPLLEIVSEPDMRSGEEAVAYLEKLRERLRYLGISDCRMQEGSMRADVNLSVRPAGSETLGTRTEMKNLNSFRSVLRAAANESARQIEILERGEAVVQESRRWDDERGESYSMRSKEDAQDYRYFPEPDLLPLRVDDAWIEAVRVRQPEFREEKTERFLREYEIPAYDVGILTSAKRLADLFEEASAICGKPKKVSNWLMTETMRLCREKGVDPEDLAFSAEHLAALVELADAGEINSTVAKQVFLRVFEEDADPVRIVEEEGLRTVSDRGELSTAVESMIRENPKPVQDYLNGKKKAIGFLVGQVMRAMQGRADPEAVREEIARRLG